MGILLRILSGALFTGMLVCIKAVSDEVPVGQSVFYRSLFALLPIVVFLLLRREFPRGLATRRPLGHALRSGLGAAAMFASFAAVALLPVAEATLLAQLTPVFMAIGGVLLLGERCSLNRAGGVVLALAGVAVLILRLAPFEYIALVWPVLADWVLFGIPVSSGFLLALPLMLSGVALAAMEGRWLRQRAR